jgi:hypothetical protein
MGLYGGTMTLEPGRISWNNSYEKERGHKCETRYTVQKEEPGTVFPTALFSDGAKCIATSKSDRNYQTFLLKLKPKPCLGSTTYFRFSIRKAYKVLEHVEYHGVPPEPMDHGYFMPGEGSDVIRYASISEDIASVYGVWVGLGRGTEAVYGTMTIKPGKISWSNSYDKGRGYKCTTSYTVQREKPDVFFGTLDKYLTTLDINQRYWTLLLKLDSKSCIGKTTYLRFFIDTDSEYRILKYLDYQGTPPKSMGSGSFSFSNPLQQ